ncbi:hypothetical protein ABW21_db0207906 [Orbilia brochopaga]|nr:hypothetical protein ABW21_db0207906 [Drechslerella brochopaga]
MKQRLASILCSWLPIIGAGLTNGRWLELQQEKWTLRLRPNLETTEVEEIRDHWISDNPRVITDRDYAWMSGSCINDIVTEPGALLTTVRYFPGDVNPEWSYILAAVQIHDGNDCNDPNAIYLPIEYDVDEQGNWLNELNPELLAQANYGPTNQAIEEERLNELMNAPTIIEEGYIPDPSEIDDYGMQLEQPASNQPQVNANAGTMEVIDSSDESSPYLNGLRYGSGNGLRRRSPANSESSDNADRPLGQYQIPEEPNMAHLADIITVTENANPVIDPNAAVEVRDEQFFQDRAESMNAFIDDTSPSNSEVVGQNYDELSQIPSSQVLDYDMLVERYRDLPFEEEAGTESVLPPLTLEANMLERGLRFGRPTSIRLVSDTTQMWIAPGVAVPVPLRGLGAAYDSVEGSVSDAGVINGNQRYQRSQ